jgi:hypothetical protein
MKTRLTLLVLAVPFLAFCQSSSVDISFSPVISDVTLKYGDPEIDEMLRRSEVPKFNWIGAINYNKPLSQSLHLRLGIQVASMGNKSAKFEHIDLLDKQSNWDGLFHFYPENPELVNRVQYSYSHRYLGTPVVLRYQFQARKLQPFVECGLIPSLYINSTWTQITNLDRQSIGRSYVYYSRFQLAGTFSAGLQYSAHPRIHLFIQPTFRYHFTSVECDVIEQHMLSAGVEFGVRKVLKR